MTEDGRIPQTEAEHFGDYNGRSYNGFRATPSGGVAAPDLTVTGVQLAGPGCGALGDAFTIVARIENRGDQRVGAGVQVTFHGTWLDPALSEPLSADGVTPLATTLLSSLDPGASRLVTVAYDAADNSPGVPPDEILVAIDEDDRERECSEANNGLTVPVGPGADEADLRVELVMNDASCPGPTAETTIFNDGGSAAADVLVRYHAGDPGAGGDVLAEELVAGPIAAGGSLAFGTALPGFPPGLAIRVHAVVDPLATISECNDGNNSAAAPAKVTCAP